MWIITYGPLKTDKKSGTQKLGGTLLLREFHENGKFWNFFELQDLMAEMSNIDLAKLENRQIFFHRDIDDYASVVFILSSSLDVFQT